MISMCYALNRRAARSGAKHMLQSY